MTPAHVVEITTPKKYLLNGLWLGPRRPRQCIIWIHGLGSSAFSKLGIMELLVDKKTSVLTFNNRGHDKVTSISRTDGKRIRGGAVHEVFTDCVDDIQGAINFAKRQGARSIVLVGHSTGCQKAVYWASKKGRGVKAVVILGPMSDYAAEKMAQGLNAIKRAEKVAREYVRRGKKQVLLPENVWRWPWIADAQRFLSLYSGNGAEEIFTYWDPSRNPRTLKSLRMPILVFLAGREEFSKQSPKKIAAWFESHVHKGHVVIVPRVKHSFRGGEKRVAAEVRRWMKRT